LRGKEGTGEGKNLYIKKKIPWEDRSISRESREKSRAIWKKSEPLRSHKEQENPETGDEMLLGGGLHGERKQTVESDVG